MSSLAEKLAKEYGIEILSGDQLPAVKRLSTGLFSLDYLFGGTPAESGVPLGRVIEIYGKEHAGKSSLSWLLLAAFQRAGRPAVLFDLEHAVDYTRTTKFGVDLNSLTHPTDGDKPMYGETIFAIIDKMAEEWAGGVVVVDSAAALVPKKAGEDDDDYNGGTVANLARLLSYSLKRVVGGGILSKNALTLIFTNQVRDNIGVYSAYGTPTVRPGGKALGFYDSILLEVKAGEVEKFKMNKTDDSIKADVERPILQECHLYTRKNKTYRPFLTAVTPLYIEFGFNPAQDLLEQSKRWGVVTGRNWLEFGGQKYNGQDAFLEALNDPALFGSLWQATAGKAFL